MHSQYSPFAYVQCSVELILDNFSPHRFTHLNHSAFTYNINVNNNSGAPAMGTCRVFLAPRSDERGTTMLLRDQRRMMMEMDRFTIARESSSSIYCTKEKSMH